MARPRLRPLVAALLAGLVAGPLTGTAWAQVPSGGTLVDGSASWVVNAATMTVTQTSTRVPINWATFDIGQSARVNFVQPGITSIALGVVQGVAASQIDGQLGSNGRVLHSNANGTVFGPTAAVDVGGLLGTSLNISSADFMSNPSVTLSAGGSRASVNNLGGNLTANGGVVALVGGSVLNSGSISADQGRISLMAADQVTVDLASSTMETTLAGALAGAIDSKLAAVTNVGTLRADGGTIVLQAAAQAGVFSTSLVNNAGTLQARGGTVQLIASGGGLVNTGMIDVSPPVGGGPAGNVALLTDGAAVVAGTVNAAGGSVVVQAASIQLSGTLTADEVRLNSNGPITQAGGLAAGTLSVNAAGSVTLMNSTNIISALEASTVAGGLALFSNTSLSQTGALDVQGNSTILSGGNLVLTNAGNRFAGSVTAMGSSVALRAAGDLNVASVSNGPNGSVSLVAGGVLTLPAAAIDTGSADLQLASNGGALAVSSALAGRNVSLTGRDGMTLSGSVMASGQLALSANPGQTILVTGDLQSSGTRINSGVVQVGNGGTSGSIAGPITNDGALVYNRSDNVVVSNTISGSGSLQKQGGGRLELTGANTYMGATVVAAGTLALSGSGSIATSGGVQVAAPAIFDVSKISASQVDVSAISGAGTISLGAKTLSVGTGNTSSTFTGVVSGAGGLLKTGSGTLTLGGANTFDGGMQLKQGRIDLGDANALGTGTLAMDDGTTLGFAVNGLTVANAIQMTGTQDPVIDTGSFDATLSGAISGGGFLTKEGSGTLTLSGANNYTGATNVAAGTLRAGAANTFSAASVHNVASSATLDLAGHSQRIAGLNNSGVVSLAGSTPGTTLTVTGAYVGNNGVLRVGTALGNSASASDRLILSGAAATASGQTAIQITNLGGLGALTSGNGIELISAEGGATTTAQTSKNAFTLAGGHVDAGAYEYRLHAADASGAGENWYLRSTTDTLVPVDPPMPGDPQPQTTTPIPTYRAEVPLLAALPAQLRQADLSMLGNLHQRIGDDDPREAATRRAWARVLSNDIDIRQGGVAGADSDGRLTGLQAGTDLLALANWRAGLYVGQLDGNVSVNGFASGVPDLAVGHNDLRSQYLGFYGTYTGSTGFYADAVLQAARHRNRVVPLSNTESDGKGHSLLASIELGQSFALGANWKFEPQVQLVHRSLSVDDMSIPGALVQQDSASDWLARAGVRIRGEVATGAGMLQPYARVNAYRASSATDVARFVGPAGVTDISTPTGHTSWELAAGATLQLSPAVDLYGEVGQLHASSGNEDVRSGAQGSVGLRVRW